jgi:predicted small secreted protein
METIKQTLLSGWNTMRLIRLVLGIFIAYQAVTLHDSMAGLIAALLLFQALSNTGCCGTQGCAAPIRKAGNPINEEIEFEEIKNK